MAKMGRPIKEVNVELIEELAAINCSMAEIASLVKLDRSTLQRRYAAVIENGRNRGKSSLKKTMWDIAVNKQNVTMCIWLSKQMLGYKDQVEQVVDSEVKKTIVYDTEWGNSSEPSDPKANP